MSSHKQYDDAILFGGINYETSDRDSLKCDLISDNSYQQNLIKTISRDGWYALPYSKQEVDSIKSIMTRKGVTFSVFDGTDATEASFKALDFKAPSIIHIATHSFIYFNNEDEAKRNKIASLSPYTSEHILMSWTGLLFYGANNTWNSKYHINGFNDGILTANEISLLHLRDTQLVVLSACSSGLGIEDAFGISVGMQKAFKLAGAQSILMSLWPVSDETTAMLMSEFYDALLSGNNRHKALKIAMKRMSKVYPDPYFWGGFVIID